MAQSRIQMAGSSGNRRLAVCALACATLVACFGGPGLEPPGGGDARGAPNVGGGGGVIGDMIGNMGAGTGGSGAAAQPPEVMTGGSFAGESGSVAPAPTDGGVDSGVDAGGDAQTPTLTCAELPDQFETALAAAQDCSGGETCTHTFIGTGCSDGLAPLCGVAHRDGADLSELIELDMQYRFSDCNAGKPTACADCAVPNTACVSGRCVTQ